MGTKYDRGHDGEVHTAMVLRNEGFGRVLQNLYIPIGDNLTQIDMILINPAGLYIIENKNYGAAISGDADDKNWVATYRNRTRYVFQNPRKQNHLHVIAVKQLFQGKFNPLPPLYNTVIFNDTASLKWVNCAGVWNLSDFIDADFDTELGYAVDVILPILTPYVCQDGSFFMEEYHRLIYSYRGCKPYDKAVAKQFQVLEDILYDNEYLPHYAEYYKIMEHTMHDNIVRNHFYGFGGT